MADEFIFDSDDFVSFCANFERISAEELTVSFIEVNLQDLNGRWVNVQRSYRTLCLVKDKSVQEDLLESARSKYSNCTTQFHRCKSQMLDIQKALVIPSPNLFAESRSPDTTFAHIKVPPCDTEVFNGGYE